MTEATLTRRLRELRDDLANNSGKPFNSIRAQGINLALYEIKRAYRAERKRKAGRHD